MFRPPYMNLSYWQHLAIIIEERKERILMRRDIGGVNN